MWIRQKDNELPYVLSLIWRSYFIMQEESMHMQELPGLIFIQRLSPPFGVSSRDSSNQRTDNKVQEALCKI